MASLGSDLGRQGSIKRTPSDLSRALAEEDLPMPEVLSRAEGRNQDRQRREKLDDRLAQLDGDEPEALVMTHRRRQSEKAQEAMAAALATLELGEPERIARANARADGAKTPIPVERSEGHVSMPSTPALEIDEPPAVAEVPVSSQAAEQVVTPWDVQGAVVEGVQVSSKQDKKD